MLNSTRLYLAQFSLELEVQHHISPALMTSTLFSDVLFPLLFHAMWYLQSCFYPCEVHDQTTGVVCRVHFSVWLRAFLTSSFLILSMMHTSSIFLSAAISNTSSCFSSALKCPCFATIQGSISDLYNLILVSFLMFLFFQMLFKSLITFKAVAVLILMSVEQSQFAVGVVPRYLNLSTCCCSFPLSNSPSFILLFTICSDLATSTPF